MKNSFLSCFLGFILFLFPLFLNAQLLIAKIFSNDMVLQRNVEIPVWGWGNVGEPLAVSFNEALYKTVVENDSTWRINLPAMETGGPFEMKIISERKILNLENILIGDVWVCSGQSNMQWAVKNSNNAAMEIANAKDVQIRHFGVPRTGSYKPEAELTGGIWEACSPETAGNFTAVGYYFAKELRKNANVPIGLLHTSWGGSRIEPWMSAEALGHADTEAALKKLKKAAEEANTKAMKEIKKQLGYLPEKDEGIQDGVAIWAAKDFNDEDWRNMELPGSWENSGLKNLDGIVWFRKEIELSKEEVKAEITLGLSKIDDSDQTWINGLKVGEMSQSYNITRSYQIPANTLRSGKNVISVRVEDTGGNGGFTGEPELMFLKTTAKNISLASPWKYKVAEFRVANRQRTNHTPTLLYNQMIHPILDFPIKGAIWYQGESNANEKDAFNYRNLFSDMIIDWRKRWNVGEFPFLFVQLANFRAAQDEPSESNWAVLRESQTETLKRIPNTGQAVIIDLGEADDIHPRNKQDVGLRLSLAARKLAYGEDLVFSGPVYKDKEIDSKKVKIHFDHIGGGLIAKGSEGELKGFAIAGADKKFVWANAKIDGNTVTVWSDHIQNPIAVRYAWADNPHHANLYNEEGLPACPFRTDSW